MAAFPLRRRNQALVPLVRTRGRAAHVHRTLRSAAYLSVLVISPVAISADQLFADAQRMTDEELSEARGGFTLPGGIELGLSIAMETRVNGQVVLRCVLTPTETEGQPLLVYAPLQNDERVSVAGVPVAARPASSSMKTPNDTAVTIDRSSGITVVQPMAGPASSVQLNVNGSGAGTTPDNLAPLPIAEGDSIATAFGTVSIEGSDRGPVVRLDDPTLQVRHILGDANGHIVANTANDRVIDTVTVVNVDLQNASPLLGSSIFRVDAVAVEAARRTNY